MSSSSTGAPANPMGVRRYLPLLQHSETPDMDQLGEKVRAAALALGFSQVGFTEATPFLQARRGFEQFIAQGRHGEMTYLAEGVDRTVPGALMPEARSIIVVALPYAARADQKALNTMEAETRAPEVSECGGFIARYARGADYHDVIKAKLFSLAEELPKITGRPVLARACVDTAPILEREAARRAGVGFIGKHTLSIIPGLGSYFLLGALLVDLQLTQPPPVNPGCGTCRACLDVCPTQAFVGEYLLDARRCVSYLTIELRGSIPRELRPLLGTMVFGCDRCQEACPHNASTKPRPFAPEFAWRQSLELPDLLSLLNLTSSGYRRLVNGSALRRVSRVRLQRNAAVALGNLKNPIAVPHLKRALRDNPSALVREHAAWALGNFTTAEALDALRAARVDADPSVAMEAVLRLAERDS